MPSFDIAELLKSFFVLAILGSIFAFFVVLALLNLKSFKRHYKMGLIIGVISFLMMIPTVIFNLIYLDPSVILDKIGSSSPSKQSVIYFVYIGIAVGILILILKIGWYMIVYYVAASEWDKINPQAFPILKKSGHIPWRPILGATAFGVIAGALSVLVFRALGVQESELIKNLQAMFPYAAEASPIIRIPILLLAVTVPAVIEELTFRGGIFAFLLRLSKGNRRAIVVSVILVSLLWSLLHIFNADMPMVKCLQIFIIGIVFCEFARRSCIESAMAGHISLNITALVLWSLLF